jgi:hypothetical protein
VDSLRIAYLHPLPNRRLPDTEHRGRQADPDKNHHGRRNEAGEFNYMIEYKRVAEYFTVRCYTGRMKEKSVILKPDINKPLTDREKMT